MILFYQWHSFMNVGIERALKKLGISYEVFFYQLSDWEKDPVFQEKLQRELKRQAYEAVFSVNYVPLISEVCEGLGLRYVAWVYDSPIHIRNIETLKNSCNEIYFFDRGQVEAYAKQGITAYHMPLAVDTEVFEEQIRRQNPNKFRSEISFLGKLYQTDYQKYTAPLSRYTKGYLEGLIAAQGKVTGGYLIPELISDKLLEQINAEYIKNSIKFEMERRELEYMLACECTGRERYMALALLSGYHHVALYSGDKEERLKNVHYCGYADYYNEMPAVFANSDINLNISLRAIQTGIPLRILDIMGCGGFVLTNYQQELPEWFTLGEECVLYEGLEDLFEKVQFYLQHETIREKIAQAGLLKVKQAFTFEERMKKILKM